MVRVIKLSMKCTLVRAFRGRHGRKKREVSAEGTEGSLQPCQGASWASVSPSVLCRCPSVLCPLSCCHDGAGEGWEEKQGITGEAPEGEKPTLLSWAPETLESDPSGCSGEPVVHPTPVGQHDCLDSGLGSFPAPGCWFPPPALPFSTLHPAAAHPPGESVFQALKTKLPGG